MSLTVHFFLEFSVIQSFDSKHIDAAKGHLILFGHHDRDTTLKVSALMDGTSIDFLFGVNNASQNSISRTKASNVKKFMRQLEHKHQVEVAKFYGKVYQAIVDYYKWRANTCCWCFDTEVVTMKHSIEEAFEELKQRLGNILQL